MRESIQYLSKRLSGYCIFINDNYQVLLIAPQKCGSTSIFKALYEQLVESNKNYEKTFSHEYTKELCIHTHLRSTQNSTPKNLQRIFADQNYKKNTCYTRPDRQTLLINMLKVHNRKHSFLSTRNKSASKKTGNHLPIHT